MSKGHACTCSDILGSYSHAQRRAWVVTMRKHNRSRFNGGRRTPSAYSEVRCNTCRAVWRTKAKYVDQLPDATT